MGIDLKKTKKRKAKSYKRHGVTPEAFVTAWSTSKSVQEVIEKTGLPKNAVYSRVNSYRKAGVKLKKLTRPVKRMDVEALNSIINTKKEK